MTQRPIRPPPPSSPGAAAAMRRPPPGAQGAAPARPSNRARQPAAHGAAPARGLERRPPAAPRGDLSSPESADFAPRRAEASARRAAYTRARKRALFALGQELSRHGHHHEAAILFRGLASISPDEPSFWVALSLASLYCGEFPMALSAAEAALSIEDTSAVRLLRVKALLACGQHDRGFRELRPLLGSHEPAVRAQAEIISAYSGPRERS